MKCGFNHRRVQGDCACCGTMIILTQLTPQPLPIDFNRVHFTLADGSLLPISLCSVCLAHGNWSLKAVEEQAIAGGGMTDTFKVTGLSPKRPQNWIEANR